jgi:tellurium resistance protein TerD
LDIVVTIHEAKMKKQNFGQLSNAFVKVIDTDTGNIVLQYDLAEQYSTETAVLIASMYRNDEQNLVFKAEGGGFAVGLDAFCIEYGLSV